MAGFGGRFWGVLGASLLVTAAARGQSRPLVPALGGAPGEHWEVAVHARSQRASARAEQAAWLSLTVPLGQLAPPRVVLQPGVPAPAPAVTPPTSLPAAPPPRATAPSPTSTPAAAPAPPAPRLSFPQLRALTELSRRATVVALAVAGAATDRRRMDALSSRARASALLPELRLRAARNTDQALRLAPTSDDPYRVTQADGAGLVLEASATFRLDRLLFAREELTVERLRQQAGEARLKLEGRVLAALLGLFRARELSCSGEDEVERSLQVVKVLELFGELDNLTAGWFSDEAARFGRTVWGFPEAVLGVCAPPEPTSATSDTKPVASLENSE